MTDKITYYAIIDQSGSLDYPAGILRRVENEEGDTDEVFSRNLKWEFSSLLYSAERGDLTNSFTEIPKEEADRIVDAIRGQADAAE